MADIFLSYNKADFEEAQKVKSALEAEGYSVWWDVELSPRSYWDQEIEREIEIASAVVVLWTEKSVKVDSFVRQEAAFAFEAKKLVPIWIEPIGLPLRFMSIQTANLTDRRYGNSNHPEWRKVLLWLHDLCGVTTSEKQLSRSLEISSEVEKRSSRPTLTIVPSVRIDRSRDALLTDFGRKTLKDRYLLPGESYQDMFARVATAYADDTEHAQRLYDYISQLWFMPATPILSNGGADRGLPISCFLNSVGDSLDDIVGTWTENVWLAANGGGIGTYWGNVRSIGEKIGKSSQTSGIIPLIRVMDSLTLAISDRKSVV